jgi:hypothetical protein
MSRPANSLTINPSRRMSEVYDDCYEFDQVIDRQSLTASNGTIIEGSLPCKADMDFKSRAGHPRPA